jgi:prepilin-type N-terminal cleavage/methylation domain-containing protein
MLKRRVKGFTLVEIMIVVAIIGIIIGIAIPGFMRAREVARSTSCQENLIKIEGALDQWAIEYDKRDGNTTDWSKLVGKTLYLKKTPKCRGGGHYPPTLTVGVSPTCDYSTPGWFDTQGAKYRHRVPDSKD